MKVDFHVHSTASDGTLPPAEIAANGDSFAAMALTDHDNADGAAEFLSAACSGRCRRYAGIELSIEPGDGFDKFHLLGIGIDPADEGIKSFLGRILEGRRARNERIIDNFRRIGIEMDGAGVRGGVHSYAHGEVLARPHFARWLVDNGRASSVAEAFDRYLLPGSPSETRCYEKRWHPPQEDSIAAIHRAGGLCVMAHPKYWLDEWKISGCDYDAAERGLAALKEKGLDGVEALYQANTQEENFAFCRIASRLGYLLSAGSDFHGANKPQIGLGMEVSEDFITPLLEALK